MRSIALKTQTPFSQSPIAPSRNSRSCTAIGGHDPVPTRTNRTPSSSTEAMA